MQIDRKNALKLWETAFGKSVEVTDFSGRKINKSAYDQKSSKFGWVLTTVVPKSEGGRETPDNIICVHVLTAEEMGEGYPVFTANDTKYRVTGSTEAVGAWAIEKAVDDETIAEQEAKNAAAIERWNELFGESYEKAVDFCGRMIHKSEFGTESEYAWKVAPYVDSKPMDAKNAYIANVLSIEEALGKTAFKANGKSFTLNKDNGAYYFKALEVKPVKKQFDIKDPYDLIERVGEIKEKSEAAAPNGVMLDFVVIRAVAKPGCTSATAASITDTVSTVLKECSGEYMSLELSETFDQNGARYMFLTYRFLTPQPSDFERIFDGAKLLNTYSPMLLALLGIDELKVYNYACFVDYAHKNYPVSMLCGYYPQFRALMDSIYGSSYGFYEGECTTTLYVSHFIVFNVPSLAAEYPEGATRYLTEAELVEHNKPVKEVSDAIIRMFSGDKTSEASEETEAPEASKAPEVTEQTAPVEATASAVALAVEEPASEPAESDSVPVSAVEEQALAVAEVEAAEVPETPSIAPVTEETVEATEVTDAPEVTEAPVAEEVTDAPEVTEAPVAEEVTEASVEEPAVDEAPEEATGEAPQNPAQMMASALASALATPEEAPAPVKAPAFPELKTEKAEQMTFEDDEKDGAAEGETESEEADDDDVVTLDLDSIF